MKPPRSLILAAAGAAAFAAALLAPRESNAQVPANDTQAVIQLVAEIAKQQAAILENQKLIDAKLAVIAENLRIARIYVARGGGAPSK